MKEKETPDSQPDLDNPDLARTSARNWALKKLDRKECSSSEVYKYLLKKKIAPEIANEVVAELQERKYLQDDRFTEIYVRHLTSRGKGPHWVRQKLMEKGIRMELKQIQTLVQESGLTTELESALTILRRKYPEANRDPKKSRQAFQGLLRRGFSYTVVEESMKKLRLGFPEETSLEPFEDTLEDS